MEQTAVTRLIENFIEQRDNGATHWSIEDLIAQLYMAKEIEKEQIINAYTIGVEEDIYFNPLKTGEEYYNETFKSE